MCGTCCSGSGSAPPLGRRRLLAGLGAAGLALGFVAGPGAVQACAGPATLPQKPPRGEGQLQVVLLGTLGGPLPFPDRAGISTALVVDGKTYLIDCGRSSVTQFIKSGLAMKSIQAIFLTHLHVDHVADYYNYIALGGINVSIGFAASKPVGVYGPGPAGGLPPKFGGGAAPIVGSANPTPGTKAMTDDLNNVFAYSSNVFIRDSGARDPNTLVDVHEIAIPVAADFNNRAPAMSPFQVYSDDTVTVSAILVPHGPIFPAFAFRFDTAYGSVAFSGDTTYTDNLIALAKNTDLLVHEAINVQGSTLPPAAISHTLQSHVEVQKVGPIAQKAGTKRLVLSHLGDLTNQPLDAKEWRKWAQDGYDGDVTVGEDLQRIVVR
jgi:ribonuclease BN (tRNA processing enzyme)